VGHFLVLPDVLSVVSMGELTLRLRDRFQIAG